MLAGEHGMLLCVVKLENTLRLSIIFFCKMCKVLVVYTLDSFLPIPQKWYRMLLYLHKQNCKLQASSVCMFYFV